MERYGHGKITLKCLNGKELYIESVEFGHVIEKMNGGPNKLVMKYGAVLSVMNSMAHLIYWKQLEDESSENICLEGSEDENGLYWLGYNKELKYLGFSINETDYLESFNGRELTEISVLRACEFYEFKWFDFIRGVPLV